MQSNKIDLQWPPIQMYYSFEANSVMDILQKLKEEEYLQSYFEQITGRDFSLMSCSDIDEDFVEN